MSPPSIATDITTVAACCTCGWEYLAPESSVDRHNATQQAAIKHGRSKRHRVNVQRITYFDFSTPPVSTRTSPVTDV